MKATKHFSKYIRGIECLNCGQPISDKDNFCSECGQVNDLHPVSIKQYFQEFFGGFFSFDNRSIRTLLPLVFKPGKVPKEYLRGKRMKYVNPFKLYINTSIIFFITMAAITIFNNYTNSVESSESTDDGFTWINLADSTGVVYHAVDSIPKLKQLIARNIETTLQQGYLDSLKSKTLGTAQKDSMYHLFFNKQLSFTFEGGVDISELRTASELKVFINTYTEKYLENHDIDYTIPQQYRLSIEDLIIKAIIGEKHFNTIYNYMQYDNKYPDRTATEVLTALDEKTTTWNIFIYKKAQDLNQFKTDRHFRDNYVQSVVSKTSIALFIMLPIFAFFVMLFYLRHTYNYTAHLIFVFSVQTVFFILLLIFNLFDNIVNTDFGTLLFIPTFLFYLERSMKNFYGQSWWKTFIKMAMLSIIFIILAIAGFVIVSFVTFLI